MRKICALLLIFLLMPLSVFGAFFKKDNPDIDSSKGYVGKLPDLTQEYQPSSTEVAPPMFDKTMDFHSENEVKPVPRDDPAFVNIILKKDKTSPYVNDLQEFIEVLEQIYDSIENNEPVQRFASRIYYLNINTEYLKDKYGDKPESNYTSYKQLLNVSEQAKNVSKLRSDAEKYRKYLAYSSTGTEYNSNNIDVKMFDLKLSIEKTINILKNTK